MLSNCTKCGNPINKALLQSANVSEVHSIYALFIEEHIVVTKHCILQHRVPQ